MNDKNFEKAETEYNKNYDPYGEDVWLGWGYEEIQDAV